MDHNRSTALDWAHRRSCLRPRDTGKADRMIRTMSKRVLLLGAFGVVALPAATTGASSAHASMCATLVDHAHVVRAKGRGSLVHKRASHRVELVLLHVSRSAFRLALAGSNSCRVDLVRFEHRWRSAQYQLHARLRSSSGSWEIRVSFLHYDAARHLLRIRGRLEDHELTSRPPGKSIPSQADNATEIVYASNFIPFDSSF